MLPSVSYQPVGSPGFPEGAGRFWAVTASLVAHILRFSMLAPRSLSRSKIASANGLRTRGGQH